KLIPYNFFDSLPGLRIAACIMVAPIALFDILAQGELDTGHRSFELHRFRESSPPEFDDLILASDRVCRTVEQVCRGEPAGKLPIDRNVIGVDDIADPHHRSHSGAGFIDAPGDRRMRMAVDKTG